MLVLYFFLALAFLFVYLMVLSALKIYIRKKNQDLVEEDNFLNSYSDYLKKKTNGVFISFHLLLRALIAS